VSNYIYNNCISSKSLCTDDLMVRLSLLNKVESRDYMQANEVLSFSACLCTLIYLWEIRRKSILVDIEYDIEENTPGDYAVFISNLP
jgi:hypothetical protein